VVIVTAYQLHVCFIHDSGTVHAHIVCFCVPTPSEPIIALPNTE